MICVCVCKRQCVVDVWCVVTDTHTQSSSSPFFVVPRHNSSIRRIFLLLLQQYSCDCLFLIMIFRRACLSKKKKSVSCLQEATRRVSTQQPRERGQRAVSSWNINRSWARLRFQTRCWKQPTTLITGCCSTRETQWIFKLCKHGVGWMDRDKPTPTVYTFIFLSAFVYSFRVHQFIKSNKTVFNTQTLTIFSSSPTTHAFLTINKRPDTYTYTPTHWWCR